MSRNSRLNAPARRTAQSELRGLARWIDDFLASRALPFSALTPNKLPVAGGVYAISITRGPRQGIVYVGTTKDLRRRIYQNHLMGDRHSSQLRNALVHFGCAADHDSAKDYIRQNCGYRFELVSSEKERQVREALAIAALRPDFSLYKSKEH